MLQHPDPNHMTTGGSQMSDHIITQSLLKELFHYCHQSGEFTHVSKRIGVTQGAIAGCKTGNGYIRISVYRKLYLAHRLAWMYVTGEWPEYQIDHINRNRSDNSFINLREATISDNHKNIIKLDSNTSGVS